MLWVYYRHCRPTNDRTDPHKHSVINQLHTTCIVCACYIGANIGLRGRVAIYMESHEMGWGCGLFSEVFGFFALNEAKIDKPL